MKFVCHNCNAKYTVSDDKVRHKRLKIRCKTCGAVIEVVDPALAERFSSTPSRFSESPIDQVSIVPEPLPSSSGSETGASSLEQRFAGSFGQGGGAPAAAVGTPGMLGSLKQSAVVMEKDALEESVWFAALDNAPVGPVSARLIHQYRRFERVTKDTLIWKEGMPDWTPLSGIVDLCELLTRIDAESAPTSLPQARPPWLGQLEETARESVDPLRGAHVGVLAERPAPVGVVSGGQSPTKPQGAAPAEMKPVVDIFEKASKAHGLASSPESSVVHSLTPPRSGSNRVYLIASVGFFVTALVTLTLVIFGGGRADGEPQSVRTVEKIVEKVVYRDREPGSTVRKSEEENAVNTPATASSSGGRGVRKTTTKKREPSEDKTSELMERMGVAIPGNRPTIGGRSLGLSGTGSVQKTDSLSAEQLKRVVNNNKGALKNCYERSLKKGEAPESRDVRVNFKLTVGASGTVKSVRLGGDGAKLDSLNGCLTQSVKRWVFPASRQESNLEFPFVFTPTG